VELTQVLGEDECINYGSLADWTGEVVGFGVGWRLIVFAYWQSFG
jgi:hypothetical protein